MRLHEIMEIKDLEAGGPGSGRHKEFFDDEERQAKHDKELEQNEQPIKHADNPMDWGIGDKVRHSDGREGSVVRATPIGKIVKWSDGKEEHVKGTVGGQKPITKIKAGGVGSGCNPDVGRCGRYAKQSFQTPAGHRFTVLKEVKRGRPKAGPTETQKKGKPYAGKKDPMHGQFTKMAMVTPWKQPRSRASIYDANRTVERWSNAKAGEGKTLVITRDLAKKTGKVVEYQRGEYGYIRAGKTVVTNFKNLGHMDGYLKSRFGISQRLKNM